MIDNCVYLIYVPVTLVNLNAPLVTTRVLMYHGAWCPRMHSADEMATATANPIMQRTIATGLCPLGQPNSRKQRISKGSPHDFDFARLDSHLH